MATSTRASRGAAKGREERKSERARRNCRSWERSTRGLASGSLAPRRRRWRGPATLEIVGSRVRTGSRATAALATVAVFIASGGAGCGGTPRPQQLGSEFSGSNAENTSFSDGGSSGSAVLTQSGPPMCNLGPNGGVCACVDEPLVFDAPNLYFVLDRSGSMNAEQKWPSVITTMGNLAVDLGPRANIGAAVFPNPTSVDTCGPGIEIFPTTAGDATAGQVGPTSTQLLEILGAITAVGGTPMAATLTALTGHIQALPGKTFVILATDGGPNCDAQLTCGADQCEPNLESVSPCSPSSPNCCTADTGGNESCLDGAATIAAVGALAASGIPVYVVGVPGPGPYGQPGQILDQLATAGGTARTTEPLFYQATTTDQSELQAIFDQVAAKATASCTLTLDNVPPDPGMVNVFVDEQPLTQTGPNGWTLDGQTVTILGESCTEILDGTVLDVRVVAGCPTVLR